TKIARPAVSQQALEQSWFELEQRAGSLVRSEEHTSELQSVRHLVCRLLLEKKNCVDREGDDADDRRTAFRSDDVRRDAHPRAAVTHQLPVGGRPLARAIESWRSVKPRDSHR